MRNRLRAALLGAAFLLSGCPAPAPCYPASAPKGRVIAGPARSRDEAAAQHPAGWYRGLGVDALIVLNDGPGFADRLRALHAREPQVELLAEISLQGMPAWSDATGWKTWTAARIAELRDAQAAAAISTVVLNLENESAPSQRLVWTGKPEQAKQCAKNFAAAVRAARLRLAVEAIFLYEDPKTDRGGSNGLVLVPFVRALKADTAYYGDGLHSGFGQTAKAANKAVCAATGAAEGIPEVWITAHRWSDAADGAAFRSDVREARSVGSVCLPERTCGDLSASLPGDAEAQLRALLKESR